MNVTILLQDQHKLETKAVIADFIKKTDFDDKLKKKEKIDKKVPSNKTKHVLVENELNEL